MLCVLFSSCGSKGFSLVVVRAKSLQASLILCNPMDYGLPGSSVHGIFQARVLEWVAISFSPSCGAQSTNCSGILVAELWSAQASGAEAHGLSTCGSRALEHRLRGIQPSCSAACGSFLCLGSNPCPLHWLVNSPPLSHQGSPICIFYFFEEPLYCLPQWL